MAKSYLFLAEGFEEVEALTTVDIMRRAGIDVATVSINESLETTGAHGIAVVADACYTDLDSMGDADWLICPGGMPGASNLAAYAPLCELLKAHAAAGGHVAAICAAPAVVLAPLGIIAGKQATCYPGFEAPLAENGACAKDARVVVDGNIVTANGPASAMPFALAIVEQTLGKGKAAQVADGLLL